MATFINDLETALVLGTSVAPASVNDTNTGSSIDLIDADGRCFAIQMIGAVGGTSPSLTGKIQESSDGSTWTDVADGGFTAVTASNNSQIIAFSRTKRHVRHQRTVAGTSPTFVLGVVIGELKKTA